MYLIGGIRIFRIMDHNGDTIFEEEDESTDSVLFDTCHCGKRVRGCVSEYYESSIVDHVGNVNINRQFGSAVVRVKTVD